VLSGVSTIHCDVYLTSRGFMSVSGPRAPGILPTIMSWTGASMHYTFAMPVLWGVKTEDPQLLSDTS